ncbi:MAG TPA: FlgD immunoglobulin-like domain containing protein, partial [bacterium]|nr:FlgD immunoglobulin-like domain containing protein [bacterium]
RTPGGQGGDTLARSGVGADVPSEFALYASRPNPVRGTAEIRFDLPAAASVSLEIYDVTGRRVRVVERGSRAAGRHAAVWDARDDSGTRVAAGIYFYRLNAGEQQDIRKIVVLR